MAASAATADLNEYETLPTLPPVGAWKQEGVAWYAVRLAPGAADGA